MNEFRYSFEDRFAETKGYDTFSADKDELNNFFDLKIKNTFCDHSQAGVDATKQKIYHVCYDCNIPLWNELYQRLVNIGNKTGVKLNWEEIKHVMRFTFIWMPPGGDLIPHTAHFFRALSAFNTPLRGKTEISFYGTNDEGKVGEKLETHEYFNPNFLNVNRYHGIKNDTNDERMILKTHLLATPWHKLTEAYEGDDVVNMWDFTVPWLLKKTKDHKKIK